MLYGVAKSRAILLPVRRSLATAFASGELLRFQFGNEEFRRLAECVAVAVIRSVGGILIYQLGSAFVDCVVMDYHSICTFAFEHIGCG